MSKRFCFVSMRDKDDFGKKALTTIVAYFYYSFFRSQNLKRKIMHFQCKMNNSCFSKYGF